MQEDYRLEETVEEAIKHWKEARGFRSPENGCSMDVDFFYMWLEYNLDKIPRLKDITEEAINRYIYTLTREFCYRPTSAGRMVYALSNFLTYLYAKGYLEKDLAKGIPFLVIPLRDRDSYTDDCYSVLL